jgi:PAS domain S-box-containing protein
MVTGPDDAARAAPRPVAERPAAVLEAGLGLPGTEATLVSANGAFAALAGRPPGEVAGRTLGFLSPDSPVAAGLAALIDRGLGAASLLVAGDRVLRCQALPPDPEGRRLVTVSEEAAGAPPRDDDAGRGADARALRAAFGRAGIGIGLVDAELRLAETNPALEALLDAGAPGRALPDLLAPEERAAARRDLGDLLDGGPGPWTAETRTSPAAGEPRILRLSVSPVPGPGPRSLVLLAEDVTETRRVERRARWLASYDAATGLPNRDLFERRADAAIERAGIDRTVTEKGDAGHADEDRLALLAVSFERMPALMLGLDAPATDRLALQVVDRLRAAAGPAAVLGRLGDGAFGALLPGVSDPAGAEAAMAALAEAFAQPIAANGRELALVPTLGAALCPRDGTDAGALVRAAGAALERARERPTGRRALYEPAMAGATVARLSLEGRLRRAIDRAEFELHYQPQADADTLAVTGFEALVRWRDPGTGRYVPPAEFIPLAEESGLILPLGELVLEEACRRLAGWRAAGVVDAPVSVNLSGRQLGDPQLCRKVLDALARTGLPADRLKIELTETVLFGSSEGHRDALMQLREAGIRLLLDDFGTGYSSLSYLKRFPIEAIKIDRSFVQAMVREPESALIVQSTIAMAHALGMQTVAEGVETRDELIFLRAYRCDQIQGYLFAKPLPPEGVEEMLRGAARPA